MEGVYLILPGCDEQNRGDQALIWETVNIAKEAGYYGDYYMLADAAKCCQSAKFGIKNVNYILKHPSRFNNKKNNISYTLLLKAKWGIVSILDLIMLEPLLHSCFRKIFSRCYSKEIQDSLKIFENSKAAFVKGGGFLHAHGGISDTYKIYYFLYHIRLAISCGIKVYIMPNSFGPFKSPFVKWMLKKTLSKCEVVMSREKVSQEQLEMECGIYSYLFTDIAFHLEIDKSFDAQNELINKGIPINKKKCVALTLRPYRFPGEKDALLKYEKYKESLAEFIIWLDQNGYYPTLIEHVFDENEHENDMICIKEVEDLLRDKCSYTVYSNRSLNCSQMKKIYSQFNFMVGTRFHSVIFSLASGVPSIAITYGGNKGEGIMKDLGLSDYSVSISEVTSDTMVCMFKNLDENINMIKKQMDEQLPLISAQKQEIIRKIRNE